MPPTYLTTHPGDVERWAARRDAVPVREGERSEPSERASGEAASREGDAFALVHADDVDLDQERLHWDEFFAEGPDQVVVHEPERDGVAALSVRDRYELFERMDVPGSQREEIEDQLAEGGTVALSSVGADVGAVDVETRSPSASGVEDRRTEPADRDVGKVVVAPDGTELGIVTAVDEDELFVDPHAGLAEAALATLGWSGVDDEDVPVTTDRIDHVTEGTVRLAGDVDGERFSETTAGR